jgi:hypothetical protein
LILDSSVIIAAEPKRQTVEEWLTCVVQAFGEVEVAISAVTLAASRQPTVSRCRLTIY